MAARACSYQPRTREKPEPSYLTPPLAEWPFCIMPPIHSETLALYDRTIELAEDFVLAAAPELSPTSMTRLLRC